MSDESSLAAPPFDAATALQSLKRELRALGLSERAGRFERGAVAMAKAAVAGATIEAARVRKPSRNSPEWLARTLRSSADLRDFVADLKRQLALWSERDD